MAAVEERIIMTPMGKTASSTTIMIERRKIPVAKPEAQNIHVGGGQHSGIIINKDCTNDLEQSPAHLQLEFKVFLVNAQTKTHVKESRQLQFWFHYSLIGNEQTKTAQEFFKELVAPLEFPRAQKGVVLYSVGSCKSDSVEEPRNELNEDKVLEVIESSYPNPITVQNIASELSTQVESIQHFINELSEKRAIKAMAPGCYTRVIQNEGDLQVVRQMPTIASNKQPTIAIITAQYCEKLAVDAMIENQQTFVRYTTVGESNVYTLGNIGFHRVVCTKLPQVGHDRSASIAAGNTTTRLLGTFQKVEHVFLVGVGGGVPHYTDFFKHVRLGDVVVGCPPEEKKFIYMYCDSISTDSDGSNSFDVKSWCPPDLTLQNIVLRLKTLGDEQASSRPWLKYLEEGQKKLSGQEMDFQRPAESTDKLYMSIGGADVIEVSHPLPPEGTKSIREVGSPLIHNGAIASGRGIVTDDQIRQDFASHFSILAYDQEFDAVLESVYGNRKDQYTVIRGICDYRDGTRNKEWQSYSALAAAAFMKAVICTMESPSED